MENLTFAPKIEKSLMLQQTRPFQSLKLTKIQLTSNATINLCCKCQEIYVLMKLHTNKNNFCFQENVSSYTSAI